MRGFEAATAEPVSTRCGAPQVPLVKRETNGWFTPPSLFRYTSAAELSGATSMSGLAVSIRLEGPSTAVPGRIAAVAGAAATRAAARATAAALSECFIEGLVDEFVRSEVLFATHRADGPFVETPQLSHGFGKQRLESRVLHLVLAADLVGDELGVVHDLDLLGAELAGELEPQQ